MSSGYLIIETHPDHPALIRLVCADRYHDPEPDVGGGRPRYVARFDDIEAARMHLHEALHDALIDLDNGLYRSDLATAIGEAEAEGLRHRRVWLDPDLGAATIERTARAELDALARRARRARFWSWVGRIALLLLIAELLFFL